MSGWRVVATRQATHTDGHGQWQSEREVTVLAYDPVTFDTQAEAERSAQHIRNANPDLDVTVEAPEAQLGTTGRPDRRAAAAGIARARAALRGHP